MSAPGAPMPGAPPQGGGPDEILAQILSLVDQYTQAGGDPIQVCDVIQQSYAGGAEGGAPPPEDPMAAMAGAGGGMPPAGGMPQDPMMGGEMAMPDMTGMPGGDYGSFADANAALEEDIKKKRPKA